MQNQLVCATTRLCNFIAFYAIDFHSEPHTLSYFGNRHFTYRNIFVIVLLCVIGVTFLFRVCGFASRHFRSVRKQTKWKNQAKIACDWRGGVFLEICIVLCSVGMQHFASFLCVGVLAKLLTHACLLSALANEEASAALNIKTSFILALCLHLSFVGKKRAKS